MTLLYIGAMAEITPVKIKAKFILPSDVVEEAEKLIGIDKEFLDWEDFLRVTVVKYLDDKKEAEAFIRHTKRLSDNRCNRQGKNEQY